MKIYQEKISDNRQDSFWYEGNIASIGNYYLRATGDVSVMFEEKDEYLFHNGRAVDEAYDRKYTDKDLAKAWYWDDNNWFEVIYDDGKEQKNILEDAEYIYDDAIKLLKRYHKEKVLS